MCLGNVSTSRVSFKKSNQSANKLTNRLTEKTIKSLSALEGKKQENEFKILLSNVGIFVRYANIIFWCCVLVREMLVKCLFS